MPIMPMTLLYFTLLYFTNTLLYFTLLYFTLLLEIEKKEKTISVQLLSAEKDFKKLQEEQMEGSQVASDLMQNNYVCTSRQYIINLNN